MGDTKPQNAQGSEVSPDPDKLAYGGPTEAGHETEKLEKAAGKKFGTVEEATQNKVGGDEA
jgi:hypothetical protein